MSDLTEDQIRSALESILERRTADTLSLIHI